MQVIDIDDAYDCVYMWSNLRNTSTYTIVSLDTIIIIHLNSASITENGKHLFGFSE